MDYAIQLPSQLSTHLRGLRKQRGLTQTALGELLGVGQPRIAEIERNPGLVSLDQLMRILSALQVKLVLQDGTATSPPVAYGASQAAPAPVVTEPDSSSASAKRAQPAPLPAANRTPPPLKGNTGSW